MLSEKINGITVFLRINDAMRWEITTESGDIVATGDTHRKAICAARKALKR